jgi:hypothetical protein
MKMLPNVTDQQLARPNIRIEVDSPLPYLRMPIENVFFAIRA